MPGAFTRCDLDQQPPVPPASYSRQDRLIAAIVALMMLVGGVALMIGGARNIIHESATIHRVPGRGPGGVWTTGAWVTLHGEDAIRCGLGLLAISTMLFVWSASFLFLIAIRAKPAGTLSMLGKCSLLVSLLSLLFACGCFYPPWELTSVGLYGVMVLWGILLTGWLSSAPRWAILTFPGPGWIIAAMILNWVGERTIASGIILGFFAGLVALAHLVELIPGISRRLHALSGQPNTQAAPRS